MNKIQSVTPHISAASTSLPYVGSAPYANSAPAGQVWWNADKQCFKITDGATWYDMDQMTTIDLSVDAHQAIEWAKQKQREEQQLEELMRQHPGLRDTHDAFKVMLALVKEYDKDKNAAP